MKRRVKTFLLVVSLFSIFLALVHAGSITDDTGAEFNLGTYNNTEWNGSAVILSGTNLSGSYTSQIFDISNLDSWQNISWTFNLPAAQMSQENLIFLLHLDESSGTIIDSSGNGYNGEYNGTLYSQSGHLNTAIGFDGSNDVINLTNNSNLDFGTDDFTIAGWVKRDRASTEGIFSKGYYEQAGFSLFFTGANTLRVRAQYDSIDTSSTEGLTFTSSEGWIFFAVVADRDGNITFYKNATLSHTESISGSSSTHINSTRELFLGNIQRNPGGTNYNFQGDLDEIRTYKRALTYEEILELYNGTSSESNASLRLKVRSCDDSSCNGESWTGKYGEYDLQDNNEVETHPNGIDMTNNVLLFHMNEESGNLTDSSTYKNNATVYGTVYYNTSGVFDTSINFSTDSYVEVNDSNSLYNPNGFTVAGWFKDEGIGSGDTVDLVSKYASSQEEWYLSADKGNNGLIRFYIYGNSGNLRRDISSTDFFDGEWHFVAATWDGGTDESSIEIYIDGVASDNQGSDTGFDTLKNTNSNIKLLKKLFGLSC